MVFDIGQLIEGHDLKQLSCVKSFPCNKPISRSAMSHLCLAWHHYVSSVQPLCYFYIHQFLGMMPRFFPAANMASAITPISFKIPFVHIPKRDLLIFVANAKTPCSSRLFLY